MLVPLLATLLAAASPAPAATAGARVEAAAASEDRLPVLGLALDAGIPSGAGASLLLRPLPWLRVHGGGGTNGAGAGLHGGFTLTPLRSLLTPTLTLEGGHFYEGDATGVAELFTQLPSFGEAALRRVSYDYGTAHLGLEIGAQDGLFFYARGGVAFVKSRIQGFEESLPAGDGVEFRVGAPRVEMVIPSAEIGVAFFIL